MPITSLRILGILFIVLVIWFLSNWFLFDRWILSSKMINIFNLDRLLDISLEMIEAAGILIGVIVSGFFLIRRKQFSLLGLGIAGIGLLAYAFNFFVFGMMMKIDHDKLTDLVTGERVVFNPERDREYASLEMTRRDNLPFNTDPETTWVRYWERDNGIAFDIPYNPNWGNESFSISPFWHFRDENNNLELQFGPLINLGSPCEPEGCMRLRSTTLTMLPLKGDQEPLSFEEIEEYFKKHVELYANVESMKLNGISMMKYTLLQSDNCHSPAIAIIGEEEYDYRLRTVGCSANIEQDFEYLEEIAKTIKLL